MLKIIDIALKDLTRSFRSLFALGMMVGAPLLITGLIYFAFGGAAQGSADLPAVNARIDRLAHGLLDARRCVVVLKTVA